MHFTECVNYDVPLSISRPSVRAVRDLPYQNRAMRIPPNRQLCKTERPHPYQTHADYE